jgi:hypothetical protein
LDVSKSTDSKVSTITKESRSHVKLDLIPVAERASRDRRGFPAVSAPEGTYGVEGHGVPRSMFYRSGEPMSAGELATRITSDSRYKAGMTVYLACCETGKGRRSFAQQLADTLGTEVVAPTEKLWPLQNGTFIVATERRYGAFGAGATESADTDRLGTMKTFKPGRRSSVMVSASRGDTPARRTYSSTARSSFASSDSRQEGAKRPRLCGMAKTAALLAELHGQTSYPNSKAH